MTPTITFEITYQEALLLKIVTVTLPRLGLDDWLLDDYQVHKSDCPEIGQLLTDKIDNDKAAQDSKVVLLLRRDQLLTLSCILDSIMFHPIEVCFTEEQLDVLHDIAGRVAILLYKDFKRDKESH